MSTSKLSNSVEILFPVEGKAQAATCSSNYADPHLILVPRQRRNSQRPNNCSSIRRWTAPLSARTRPKKNDRKTRNGLNIRTRTPKVQEIRWIVVEHIKVKHMEFVWYMEVTQCCIIWNRNQEPFPPSCYKSSLHMVIQEFSFYLTRGSSPPNMKVHRESVFW